MAKLKDLVGGLALCLLIDNVICQYDNDWRSYLGDVKNQNPFYIGKQVVKRSTHNAGYTQGLSDNHANNDENQNVKNNIDDVLNIPTKNKHRKRRQSVGVWPIELRNPKWFFNSAQRFTQPPRNFPTIPQFPRDIHSGFYDAFLDPVVEQSGSRFSNVLVPKEYPYLNNFFIGPGHLQFTPWRINSQWFSPLYFIPVYCNRPYLPPREQPNPDGTTTVEPPTQPSVNMTVDDRFGTDRNWGPVDPTTGRPILPNDMNNVPPAMPNNPNDIEKLPPANPDGDDDENYTIREISFQPVQPSRQPSITPPPVEHGGDAPSVAQAQASASASAFNAGNNIVGDLNFGLRDNRIIPLASSNSKPIAPRPELPESRTSSPPRQSMQNIPPQARPPPPRPEVTSAPPLNMREQPSPCVLAIISCCVPNSEQVQDNCFENFGCAGPFWDRSPCNSEIAKTAIMVFRQLNSRFSTGVRPAV